MYRENEVVQGRCHFSLKDYIHCNSSLKVCNRKKTVITVNLEIFARMLFSREALKDIFATLIIRDYGMIYLHQ